MTFTISKKEARKLALHCQGLLQRNPFGRGKEGVLKAVEHLGYIQIDTISVIKRTHHHTLWTRVPNYSGKYLDDLQREKRIFEYWSHAAAYLPMSEFRFYLLKMRELHSGPSLWFKRDKKMRRYVLARITKEGPLMARNFAPPPNRKSEPWWGWKPAKIALEQLFMEGELMIVARKNFQKVYDLPERVLPSDIDLKAASTDEYCHFLINRAILAHGLVSESEIGYQLKGMGKKIREVLKRMLESKEILTIKVKELQNLTYYSNEDILNSMHSKRKTKKIHLLSPFDNSLIQRKRVLQLFDFNYQLECYLPKEKRLYGYFCLPILLGDRFIGRLDPKADRSQHLFRVNNLVFEKNFNKYEKALPALAKKLKQLAQFNDCANIEIVKTTPKLIRKELVEHIH